MKKIAGIIILSALFLNNNLFGCDACGCSAASSFGGLVAFNATSFIGLRYGFYSLETKSPENIISSDFSMVEISGAYKFSDRWQLFGYLPYRMVKYNNGYSSSNENGIGDAGLLGSFVAFESRPKPNQKFASKFLVRAGVELPTGDFNENWRTDHLPATLALGSGSFDFIAGGQFRASKKSFSLLCDYSVKYNTANKFHYTTGMQQSIALIAMLNKEIKSVKIMPYAGLNSEINGSDKFYDVQQEGTKGEFLFANAGVEFTKQKLTLGLSASFNVYSGYNTDFGNRYGLKLNYALFSMPSE